MVSDKLSWEEPTVQYDRWLRGIFLKQTRDIIQESLVHIGVKVCMAQIDPERLF
jgi:hypothetical protein